jgi:predicted ATPase
MVELTTLRVEKPAVEWLNSIKGFLEWQHGKKYTLNQALIIILAEFDTKYAIAEGYISPLSGKKKMQEYMNRRLKQFWGESEIPKLTRGHMGDFIKDKKRKSK